MSIRKTDVKVYLYNNDYNRLCAEIYLHQRIETGGNLFGLWTTTGNAVVHVALGPGKQCRRTDVSFHQDIPYLSRVGTFLTQKFMLCHIGEWHSHHRLSLNEPSSGDKRTVRENYPNGVKKFLVIIGNIVGTHDRVILSPYFFSDGGNTCEKGKLEVLIDTDSPFTMDSTIAKEMNEGAEGAESPSHDLIRSCSPNKDQQQTAPDRSGANGHSRQSTKDVSSNPSDRSSGTGTQNSAHDPPSSGSHASAVTSGGSAPADKNPFEVKHPPNYLDTSVPSQTTPASPFDHPLAYNNPSNLIPSSASEVKIDDSNNQTRQEVILKKVFDEIKSKFVDSDIAIERSRAAGVIEMRFKHNNNYWLLNFPESFPEKPAEIFNSFSERSLISATNCARHPESLNNHIDILLTIKSQSHCSSYCACQKLNVQSLDQACTPELFLTEKGCAMIKELWVKVKDTSLAEVGSLKKEMKYDDIMKYAFLQVSFKHSSKFWAVHVRSTFPNCPAKVYWKYESSRSYRNTIPYESGQLSSKDWATQVLFAIGKNCDCATCRRS